MNSKLATSKDVKLLRDSKAESLEQAGLWRRAASRWLDVMDITDDLLLRHAVVLRRNYCLSMAKNGKPDKRMRINL